MLVFQVGNNITNHQLRTIANGFIIGSVALQLAQAYPRYIVFRMEHTYVYILTHLKQWFL